MRFEDDKLSAATWLLHGVLTKKTKFDKETAGSPTSLMMIYIPKHKQHCNNTH